MDIGCPTPNVTRRRVEFGAPACSRLNLLLKSGPAMTNLRPKPAKSRRSRPPYNPGLPKLVIAKQSGSEPLEENANAQGFLGWHQRGYLPHYDAPGVTQFVTFRLHDAVPASRRSEWKALLQIEEDRERRRLEVWLDRGYGECWLRQSRIAKLAEDALRFFDGQRYRLHAWMIMPNHIHVLVEVGQTPLAEMLATWKRFISREANKLPGRAGPFWEREYWDTWMRDGEQSGKAVRYIEANPVKAGLVRQAGDWQWSSARFRDAYGRLQVRT